MSLSFNDHTRTGISKLISRCAQFVLFMIEIRLINQFLWQRWYKYVTDVTTMPIEVIIISQNWGYHAWECRMTLSLNPFQWYFLPCTCDDPVIHTCNTILLQSLCLNTILLLCPSDTTYFRHCVMQFLHSELLCILCKCIAYPDIKEH